MKKVSNLLKEFDLKALGYRKLGKVTIVNTNNGKYVIKDKSDNKDIFTYLQARNFNYYPNSFESNNYVVSEYIDDIKIPIDQKAADLISLTALLHSKTTYYKEVDVDDYKKIYEDLSNNIEYLKEYYNDLITIIESKVYMSPSEYLLARNISQIFRSLNFCINMIEKWYELIKDNRKMRVAVVHNNLNLEHFIKNEKDYLISWDKSKIDIPVFDLYKFYNKHALDLDFSSILEKYESIYPLKDDELILFYILIAMPSKIEFDDTIYEMCKRISREMDKSLKTEKLVSEYKKEVTS